MSHVQNFNKLFTSAETKNKKGYILDLSKMEDSNPFRLFSRHIGENGGKMAIRSRILYVCGDSFDHPDAKQLALK